MASKETPTKVGVSLLLKGKKVGKTPIGALQFVKSRSLQTHNEMLFSFKIGSFVSVSVTKNNSYYICPRQYHSLN